jgi:hypothetical protein
MRKKELLMVFNTFSRIKRAHIGDERYAKEALDHLYGRSYRPDRRSAQSSFCKRAAIRKDLFGARIVVRRPRSVL